MKKHTIRSTLFASYSVIIFISFVAFSTFFVWMEIQNLRSQTFEALKQNAQSVGVSIDGELTQMNMVSMNVAYSNLVKDTFYRYIHGKQSKDQLSNFENAKMLGELLTSILGPNQPVDQVNLYALEAGVVASGLSNATRDDRAKDQVWYQALLNSEYSKTVFYTGMDPHLSRYYSDPEGKKFISLVRRYYDVFNNPQGYVEIQESMRKVLVSVLNYRSLYGEEMIVLDQSGAPILDTETKWDPDLLTRATGHPPDDFVEIQAGEDIGNVFSYWAPSSQSGFSVILLIRSSDVLIPAASYLRGMILPVLISLFLALLLAFWAAKRLTRPIRSIYHEVRQFDLGNPLEKQELRTNIIEIGALHEGFLDMRAKVETSLQKQLLFQQQEMQSRMLALQSQMNPHFLFNSLAAIQSMAEEGMEDEIVTMCQAMSRILRYISSDTGMSVQLEAELTCAEDFLQCMVIRYQGDLSYDMDIPDALMGVLVPKLCLQLLAENAVKFVTTNRPPWHIHISGSATADRYELTVSDNGPGFDEATLHKLNLSIREISRTGLLPSLSIGGMGLLNICIRFQMLQSQDVIFIVSNNAQGGASVTIGGYYHG